MSDYILDTPDLGRPCCLLCEPNVDQTVEILNLRHCSRHDPVNAQTYFPSLNGGMAEGYDNKLWCDFLHRGTGKR